MKVEVITIGDELLIGQVVDTNSAWIGSKLNENGIQLSKITSIGDSSDQIFKVLDDAIASADAILITGGLGPTKDDITKKTLAEYFHCGFKTDEQTLERVKNLLQQRGISVTDINYKQAEVPEVCDVIQNHNGTAPCMVFRKNGKLLVSMPGVPFEMKGLMEDAVLRLLIKESGTQAIIHKTIMTTGVPESVLAKRIEEWEMGLPKNMKLAYLPSLYGVRLRITATGTNKVALAAAVEQQVDNLKPILKEDIFSFQDETLEEVVGRMLRSKNLTVATAESCTGGTVASTIVSVPGASLYFKGGVVAYDNEVKKDLLKVSSSTLSTDGAVSKPVVEQMAEGVKELLKTDFAIATSGIAGPDGGTDLKPVGATWIAVASPKGTVSAVYNFGNNRERTMIRATAAALNLLRIQILKAN
jgi:nicotinamide-nucleotide amidase